VTASHVVAKECSLGRDPQVNAAQIRFVIALSVIAAIR
jgi:hypothetical protein